MTAAELMLSYAGVRARLYGRPQTAIVPRAYIPGPDVEIPKPRPIRKPREYLYVVEDIGSKKFGVRSSWKPARELEILQEVALEHRVFIEQIKGQSRNREVVAARFECYYRMYTELGYSLPMVGIACGGKEHSGVMHGIRKFKERNGAKEALERDNTNKHEIPLA